MVFTQRSASVTFLGMAPNVTIEITNYIMLKLGLQLAVL